MKRALAQAEAESASSGSTPFSKRAEASLRRPIAWLVLRIAVR
jgi:hypothetical protein